MISDQEEGPAVKQARPKDVVKKALIITLAHLAGNNLIPSFW